jgi:hypothetical protein
MREAKIKDIVQYILYIIDFQKQLNDEVKWLRKLRINLSHEFETRCM